MKTILKYLKPFAAVIVVSLLFLFAQAYCDLLLPNLMSDIVDTGIQNSGITETAPRQISKNGVALMTAFMTPEDEQIFRAGYEPDEDGVYQALWDAEGNAAPDAELAQIYGRACYSMVTFLSETTGQSGDAATGAASSTEVDMASMYAALLPQLEAANGALAGYGDPELGTDYTSYGKTFTRFFYTELGVDVAGIQRAYIFKKGGVMLLIALATVAAAVAVGFLSSRVGSGLARNLRHDVFSKVEGFSDSEFNKFSTASLITRTTNDVQQVQMLTTMVMRMLAYAPIMGVGGVVMALSKSPSLSWIIAAAVALLIVFVAFMFRIAIPKFNLQQKLIDKLNLVSRENLTGMMVIRAFGNEKYEEKRFERANGELTATNRFVQRAISLMFPFMSILMNLVTVGIVWFGANAIAASTLQIGDMMAFMQYAMQIIMSFLMISMMFIMVPRAAVSVKRIEEVLGTDNTVVDPASPKKLAAHSGGRTVEFRNVSFRYEKAEDDVLTDISFTAKPGETTAFIGSTGSGKSTLINLIPRFYDVTGGSILVDGVDVRQLAQHDLRAEIGYIPQKGLLFSGTVASNVRYGKEDADAAELDEAIRTAQAEEFVSSMEDGVESEIAQGGDNVSGGQKQRLSIARALVRKAPIYIFDDSFSALDFKTDAALRRALESYTGGATVLIVAQRVSTIMNAERIVVLDEGKIVGIGTHRELLQSCETYREIAQSQLSAEELA